MNHTSTCTYIHIHIHIYTCTHLHYVNQLKRRYLKSKMELEIYREREIVIVIEWAMEGKKIKYLLLLTQITTNTTTATTIATCDVCLSIRWHMKYENHIIWAALPATKKTQRMKQVMFYECMNVSITTYYLLIFQDKKNKKMTKKNNWKLLKVTKMIARKTLNQKRKKEKTFFCVHF